MKITRTYSTQVFAALAVSLAAPLLHAGTTEVTVQPPAPNSSTDIQLRIDGTVIAKGIKGGVLQTSDQAAGVRLHWHPGKAALRVGEFTTSVYDSDIGLYSFALGLNARAAGGSSISLGDSANSYASNDIALGYHTVANLGAAIGNQSSAYYNGYAFGTSSFGMMNGIGLGFSASASYTSAALGSNVTASNYSTAIGYQNNANNSSTALGNFTTATGKYATSLGYSTSAQAYGSTVIGQFNETEATSNLNSWQPTDFLFVIGNGTSTTVGTTTTTVRKNAVVVRKNGDVGVQGVLRVWPAGDVSMGLFLTGTEPPKR